MQSFLNVSFFLRTIVPRIFIADQRIQGIFFALDLLRDTENPKNTHTHTHTDTPNGGFTPGAE